jgi:Holliday junction resolvase
MGEKMPTTTSLQSRLVIMDPRCRTVDIPFKLPPPVVILDLPYPVSSNDVWTRTKSGIRKSDEYKAWLSHAGLILNRQKPKPIKGGYLILIEACRPDQRRRDIDNIIGSVSDLLQAHGVIENDCLCEQVTARWVKSCEGVRVTIEQAGDGA